MPYKRVSANSASVAFWILLSRLFDSFCGGCIKLRILPPQKESKIGQNNLKKRRSLDSQTLSKFYSLSMLLSMGALQAADFSHLDEQHWNLTGDAVFMRRMECNDQPLVKNPHKERECGDCTNFTVIST